MSDKGPSEWAVGMARKICADIDDGSQPCMGSISSECVPERCSISCTLDAARAEGYAQGKAERETGLYADLRLAHAAGYDEGKAEGAREPVAALRALAPFLDEDWPEGVPEDRVCLSPEYIKAIKLARAALRSPSVTLPPPDESVCPDCGCRHNRDLIGCFPPGQRGEKTYGNCGAALAVGCGASGLDAPCAGWKPAPKDHPDGA